MARYIDADKLCKGLEEMAAVLGPFKQSTILGAVETIKNMPTADVVPKSEVEKLEQNNEDLRNVLTNTIDKFRNCKAEVAREIFEEIEKLSHRFMNDKHYIFGDMVWDIAELKKKYTEETK